MVVELESVVLSILKTAAPASIKSSAGFRAGNADLIVNEDDSLDAISLEGDTYQRIEIEMATIS